MSGVTIELWQTDAPTPTVKPWFQGKLPFTFNLPDVETSPFKLIGGRLTYFQQSPGACCLTQENIGFPSSYSKTAPS